MIHLCFGAPDECQNCGGSASLGDTQEPWRDRHGNPFCSETCLIEAEEWKSDFAPRAIVNTRPL